jgi:hypothetical protein
MATEDRHFTHSTFRERIVEHVFVGDVLRTLWRLGVSDVDILRSEFDAHGYDLVMSRGSIVRHVQLKTQAAGKVSVSRALAEKPSGCVVWIGLNKDTLELGPFMWFGGVPGRAAAGHFKLSEIPSARHTDTQCRRRAPRAKESPCFPASSLYETQDPGRRGCAALWGCPRNMTSPALIWNARARRKRGLCYE